MSDQTVAEEGHEEQLTQRTGLDEDGRRQRASRAGKASQSMSAYVTRINRGVSKLSPEDIEVLRQIVGRVDQAAVYAEGIKTGAKLAREAVAKALAEVVAA